MGSSLLRADLSTALGVSYGGTYYEGVLQIPYEITYTGDGVGFKRNYDVSILVEQPTNIYFLWEIVGEWPEILKISDKLMKGEKLSGVDVQWVNEIAEATGWEREDIIEDIKNIRTDPLTRVERYERLFEEYYRKALEYKDKGDRRQAGEKIWGATTALIKLYAAIKGVPVTHWYSGKLQNFVTNNVEPQYKKLFTYLLSIAKNLHENFYEDMLNDEAFKQIWDETLELLEQAKKIVGKSKKR